MSIGAFPDPYIFVRGQTTYIFRRIEQPDMAFVDSARFLMESVLTLFAAVGPRNRDWNEPIPNGHFNYQSGNLRILLAQFPHPGWTQRYANVAYDLYNIVIAMQPFMRFPSLSIEIRRTDPYATVFVSERGYLTGTI